MDPADIVFLKGFAMMVLAAGAGLSAWKLWLRTRELSAHQADPRLDTLRDDHAQLRDEMESRLMELENRVDFAERRLAQERLPLELPEPRHPTPV